MDGGGARSCQAPLFRCQVSRYVSDSESIQTDHGGLPHSIGAAGMAGRRPIGRAGIEPERQCREAGSLDRRRPE